MRAIVTGAARGIGAAVAGRLARDGGSVACVDVNEDVTATARALANGTVIARVADVSDEAAVEALVTEIDAEFDGLDLLVNCAGIGGPADPVGDLDATQFRRTLDVNLVGTFLMARAFARARAQRDRDRREPAAIVNIGSLFGQQGVANSAAYCASKGAIATLTHTLAQELGPDGVRVNTIAPGYIDTEMHFDELRERARRAGTTVDDELHSELGDVPLGRIGTGDDIAGVVAWLASPDSAYVTGQTIPVNGGVLMS